MLDTGFAKLGIGSGDVVGVDMAVLRLVRQAHHKYAQDKLVTGGCGDFNS
jgi:hypothetical protein